MKTFLQCYEEAKAIVAKYRAELPDGFDPQAFDVGGGTSNADTRFSRTGTSAAQKDYSLSSGLTSLIQAAQQNATVPSSLVSGEQTFLSSLLSRNAGQVPGLSLLTALQQLDPSTFSGSSALNSIVARNPYSTDYESATSGLYNRMFNQARAQAQSGPANVRGGTARQGFELADVGTQQSLNRFREVRGQQDKEAGIVRDAVQLFNTIEQMRRGTQLQSQGHQQQGELARDAQGLGASDNVAKLRTNNLANIATAAEFTGKPTQTTTDNLAGFGNQVQNTSHWGAGITCCFILMEAFHGEPLPWYVRRGRDEFATGARIRGYRWMANWLVPWMRAHRGVFDVVDVLLIRPFLICGRFHYEGKRPVLGRLLKPVAYVWLGLWGVLGRFVKGHYNG